MFESFSSVSGHIYSNQNYALAPQMVTLVWKIPISMDVVVYVRCFYRF